MLSKLVSNAGFFATGLGRVAAKNVGKSPSLGSCPASPQPVPSSDPGVPTNALSSPALLGIQHIMLTTKLQSAVATLAWFPPRWMVPKPKIKISALFPALWEISGLQPQPHSRRVTRVESCHSRMVIKALPLFFRLFEKNSPWERC